MGELFFSVQPIDRPISCNHLPKHTRQCRFGAGKRSELESLVLDQGIRYILIARGNRIRGALILKIMDETLEQMKMGRMIDIE
jgi:hypothetical protein